MGIISKFCGWKGRMGWFICKIQWSVQMQWVGNISAWNALSYMASGKYLLSRWLCQCHEVVHDLRVYLAACQPGSFPEGARSPRMVGAVSTPEGEGPTERPGLGVHWEPLTHLVNLILQMDMELKRQDVMNLRTRKARTLSKHGGITHPWSYQPMLISDAHINSTGLNTRIATIPVGCFQV